jgi:hypothetical protein
MAHLLPVDGIPAAAEAGAAAAARGAATERFVNPATGRSHAWALGRKSVEDAVAAIGRGERCG